MYGIFRHVYNHVYKYSVHVECLSTIRGTPVFEFAFLYFGVWERVGRVEPHNRGTYSSYFAALQNSLLKFILNWTPLYETISI